MSTIPDNVFTVFFHGTNYDRNTDYDPNTEPKELIAQLSQAAAGTEAKIVQTATPTKDNPLPYTLETKDPTYLICEGPGSKDFPGKDNPLLNTSKNKDATEINPALDRKKTSGFQKDFTGNTDKNSKINLFNWDWLSKLSGTLDGSGWDDNVYKACWLLTHLKWSAGRPIDTINLVGWSRGAVSCLKTANKLFEVFEDTININIFAIDPVPGQKIPLIGDTWTDDNLLIPQNVRHYAAVLALDENGSFFEPTDRSNMKLLAPRSQHGKQGNPDSLNPDHTKPHVHFLPFPGNHSDLVNVELSCPEVADSAKLIGHLAWQFLVQHGSVFTKSFDMTVSDAQQTYTRLFANRYGISEAARGGLVNKHGFAEEREVTENRTDYVQDASRYLNEHHRLLTLGADTPAVTSERFAPSDWVNWNDHRAGKDARNEWKEEASATLKLPPQANLRAMGLGQDNS